MCAVCGRGVVMTEFLLRLRRAGSLLVLIWVAGSRANVAQSATGSLGPAAASEKLEFEVASVKQNKSAEPPRSNFPLNPGVQYGSNGGTLRATNMILLQYIVFAFKMTSYQIQDLRAHLPDWARSDYFDIEARAAGEPTKDEMRRMMQSLLAERFGMRVHHEIRQVPVFLLVAAKPGRLGPQLRVHPADDPDCLKEALPQSAAGGYPAACGAGASMQASAPGLTAIAGRKVTMDSFVVGLTNLSNNITRPVIDQTGFMGAYNYTLEWAPEDASSLPAGSSPEVEAFGPNFSEALKEQLGLKLVSSKGPVDVIVLDHVEFPVAN